MPTKYSTEKRTSIYLHKLVFKDYLSIKCTGCLAVAEVYIGTSIAAVSPTGNTPIGTFKTTPNNAGVGMFDLRNVVENYVKADNMAANGSAYKTTITSDSVRHPVHLIDK